MRFSAHGKALPNNQMSVGFLTISSNVFIIQKIFFYNTYFRSNANGIYHNFGIIIFNIEFFYIVFIILQSRARLQKCLASLIIYITPGLGKSLIDTNKLLLVFSLYILIYTILFITIHEYTYQVHVEFHII